MSSLTQCSFNQNILLSKNTREYEMSFVLLSNVVHISFVLYFYHGYRYILQFVGMSTNKQPEMSKCIHKI